MHEEPDRFTLQGHLLAGAGEGWLRLLVGSVYLDLEEDGLLELEELPPPAELRSDVAVSVLVTLRRGCRLREVGDGRSFAEQIWRRPVPFAFASRADDPAVLRSARFAALEAAYVARLDGGGPARS